MVDFKKKLQKAQLSKATDPKEIYATLDRTGAAGPTLRPSQEVVLADWYANHILKKIQKEAREWLKNKIEEEKNTKRCETTIE